MKISSVGKNRFGMKWLHEPSTNNNYKKKTISIIFKNSLFKGTRKHPSIDRNPRRVYFGKISTRNVRIVSLWLSGYKGKK